MTTALEPIPAAPTVGAAPQWQRSARFLLRVQARTAGWFFGLVVVGVTVVMAVVGRFTTPTLSGLQFAQHGALWFPFSMALILVGTWLPMHVVYGMTRRSFVVAHVVVSAVVGLGYALAMTLLLLVERQAYAGLGWRHGGDLADGGPVFVGGVLDGGVGSHLAGLALLVTAGQLSGMLVGAGYLRFGGWGGTLLLPLALAVPIGLTSLVALDPRTQFSPVDADLSGIGLPVAAPFGLLLGLLALAVTVLATYRILRDVRIRPPQS